MATGLPLEALDIKNPTYDLEFWLDLNALYRGGKAMRDRISRFLAMNPMETPAVYKHRLDEASYTSYLGSIIAHYAAYLFAGDFRVRAKMGDNQETEDAPPEYALFREDVGGDHDMKSFLKERFVKALVEQRSHWLCVLPAARGLESWPESRKDHEKLGLKEASLVKVDAADLTEWEVDENGKLLYAVIHHQREVRKTLTTLKRTIVETWAIYDQEFCTEYKLEYAKGERPDPKHIVPGVSHKHGFNQVPLVTLGIPDDLWVADRVYDPQRANFRLNAALDWAIKKTCYAMPIFNVEDEERPPRMGIGHYIMIGVNEKFAWSAPPNGQFDTIAKQADNERDAIYRVTHQMAQGLDNNADTVGRSGDSKEIDTAATRIILNAFGDIVASAIEETYEIVSDAFGDTDISWSIEGLSGYDTTTAPEVIQNALNGQLINVPSPTFHAEVKYKAAAAILAGASQDVLDKIRKEILAGVNNEADLLNMSSAANAQATKQAELQVRAAAEARAAQGPPGGKPGAKRPA